MEAPVWIKQSWRTTTKQSKDLSACNVSHDILTQQNCGSISWDKLHALINHVAFSAAYEKNRTECVCPTECNLTSFTSTPSVASLSSFGVTELLQGNNKRMKKRLVGSDGPLTRYQNLRVAHAPRMLGTFSPPNSKETIPVCRMRNPQFTFLSRGPYVIKFEN